MEYELYSQIKVKRAQKTKKKGMNMGDWHVWWETDMFDNLSDKFSICNIS